MSEGNGKSDFQVAGNAQTLVHELLTCRQEVLDFLAMEHDPPMPDRDRLVLKAQASILHGIAMPIASQINAQQRRVAIPRPVIHGARRS